MTPTRPLNPDALTPTQKDILKLCDNPMGRIGWPLSTWEANGGARDACAPLIRRKLLKERRLGGYPGVEITKAGRAALALAEKGEGG